VTFWTESIAEGNGSRELREFRRCVVPDQARRPRIGRPVSVVSPRRHPPRQSRRPAREAVHEHVGANIKFSRREFSSYMIPRNDFGTRLRPDSSGVVMQDYPARPPNALPGLRRGGRVC